MAIVCKQVQEAIDAVEQHPSDRQKFSDLGSLFRHYPRTQRMIFERLAGVLLEDPKNPVLYLNLSSFATAAMRFDIAKDFSSAAFNYNEKKHKLKPDERELAGRMYHSASAKRHSSKDIHNPLLNAAEQCGIEHLAL